MFVCRDNLSCAYFSMVQVVHLIDFVLKIHNFKRVYLFWLNICDYCRQNEPNFIELPIGIDLKTLTCSSSINMARRKRAHTQWAHTKCSVNFAWIFISNLYANGRQGMKMTKEHHQKLTHKNRHFSKCIVLALNHPTYTQFELVLQWQRTVRAKQSFDLRQSLQAPFFLSAISNNRLYNVYKSCCCYCFPKKMKHST